METQTYQELLAQYPAPPSGEIPPWPPILAESQNSQSLLPHEWPSEKLRKLAGEAQHNLQLSVSATNLLEDAAAYHQKIGKYDMDNQFTEEAFGDLERTYETTQAMHREIGVFFNQLNHWVLGFTSFIGKLKLRSDIPEQLCQRFGAMLKQAQELLARSERAYKVMREYEVPVYSSILLALAKHRELTGDEKKLLLESAVFHGPIDNPPSNRRADWYDDDGR